MNGHSIVIYDTTVSHIIQYKQLAFVNRGIYLKIISFFQICLILQIIDHYTYDRYKE